jgi:membrane-associated phospholipid phosphatase
MSRINTFYKKYRHAIPLLLYGIVYITWFGWLEEKVTKHFHVIHMDIDDYIPFCELFIIPYYLWFAYIAVVIVFLFFTDKNDYYKACIFLATGMTIFLTISTLWPNGHHLRPIEMPRDNFFTQLVSFLYNADTPTNLWPSIHVYNSLGAHLAVAHCKALEKHKGVRVASLILAVSIVFSTMFLKQHSAFDVITALILASFMYALVYRFDIISVGRTNPTHRKSKPQIG